MEIETTFNFILARESHNIEKRSVLVFDCINIRTWENGGDVNYKQTGGSGDESRRLQFWNPQPNRSPGAAPFKFIRARRVIRPRRFRVPGLRHRSRHRRRRPHRRASHPCRITDRKAKIRRQKVVAIQACSRDLLWSISSRDGEKEREGLKRDVAKFGRRAVLKWRTSD